MLGRTLTARDERFRKRPQRDGAETAAQRHLAGLNSFGFAISAAAAAAAAATVATARTQTSASPARTELRVLAGAWQG